VKLHAEFTKRNEGLVAYDWQIDVSEALLLGLDCLVIAGTGAGKMMPFVMPLFVESDRIMIIILPLNALEEDQVLHVPFRSQQQSHLIQTLQANRF
jgi:superfamily II DNA helicase RecQ